MSTSWIGPACGRPWSTPAHHPDRRRPHARRRAELLDWARQVDGLVLEDDYDAEFRYDRRPVGTVQGMDPARVALLGSLSKTLSTALGLGRMLTPPRWTARLRATPAPAGPPVSDQLALAAFLRRGSYDRHLRASRQRYRARRDALVRELGARLPGCPVSGAAAGLHLLLDLPAGVDAAAVVAAAARRDLRLAPLRRYRAGPDAGGTGLVLGYGNLADAAVGEAVGALAAAVRAAPVLLDQPVPDPAPRGGRAVGGTGCRLLGVEVPEDRLDAVVVDDEPGWGGRSSPADGLVQRLAQLGPLAALPVRVLPNLPCMPAGPAEGLA